MPVSKRTMTARYRSEHDLYKNGDIDVPECITDGYGVVVLGLCRKCGRGESELSEPCAPRWGKWIDDSDPQAALAEVMGGTPLPPIS